MKTEKYGCGYLNSVVKQMTMEAYSKKGSSSPLPIEFKVAEEIKYEVYQVRDKRVTITVMFLGAVLFGINFRKLSWPEFVFTILFCWINTDIYTGLVHIVLDHKDVILYKLPDLWRPALEFQWHHYLPHDIVTKPVMCVLGDINRAVTPSAFVLSVSAWFNGFEDHIFHFGFACKLFMAYLAQLSHRLTHCTTSQRPWFARPFGFLLLKKVEHQMHHKDHGKNFTILNGLGNPFLNLLVSCIGLETVWPYVGMLVFMTFFDTHYIAHRLVPAVCSMF